MDLMAIAQGGQGWKRAWEALDPARRSAIIARSRRGRAMAYPSDAAFAAGLARHHPAAIYPDPLRKAERLDELYHWPLAILRWIGVRWDRMMIRRARRANLAVVRAHLDSETT